MLRPCTTAVINQQARKLLVPPKSIFDIIRSVQDGDREGDPFKHIATAKEAQYFKKREKQLLVNLKEEMKEQISFHERQIAIHKAVIEKLKKKQQDIEDEN